MGIERPDECACPGWYFPSRSLYHRQTYYLLPCSEVSEEHLPGIFDVFLDLEERLVWESSIQERLEQAYLDKECDGFPTIEQTVVVGESEVHHLHIMLVRVRCISDEAGGIAYRADFDFAVHNDWAFLDSVQAEDS